MKFWGKHGVSLDKGRLRIPAKFRKHFKEEVIVVLENGNLSIYPTARLRKFDPEQIWKVRIDKQGRILIPLILRQLINSGAKLTWLGKGDHLEIQPNSWITLEADEDKKRVILHH